MKLILIIYFYIYLNKSFSYLLFFLGIGDWGLGIGDWGFWPKTQTPKPKTQNPKTKKIFYFNFIFKKIN